MHFYTFPALVMALCVGAASWASAADIDYAGIGDRGYAWQAAHQAMLPCQPGNYGCAAPVADGGPYCDGIGLGTDARMGTERIAPKPLINQSPSDCDARSLSSSSQ